MEEAQEDMSQGERAREREIRVRDRGVGGEANTLIGVGDIHIQPALLLEEEDDKSAIHSSFLLVRSLEKGRAGRSKRAKMCCAGGGERGALCEEK